MKTISISIFSLFLFIGCNNLSKNEFARYYSQIPVLEYPIILDCLKETKYFNFPENEEYLVGKYKPINCSINGRLPMSNNVVAIIYSYPGDSMYPILFTYDRTGQSIDTLKIGSLCLEWMGTYLTNYVQINSDRTIQVIDSTKYYSLDKNDDIIPKTDSLVIVEKSNFNLNENGHFSKIYYTKDTLNRRLR